MQSSEGRQIRSYLVDRFAKAWPVFAIGASWDAITTVIGSVSLLAAGGVVLSIAFGLFVGLTIAATLFFTFEILDEHEATLRNWPLMHKGLKVFWALCLLYNASTAYFGNAWLLGVDLWNPSKATVLLGSTIILSLSTLIVSFLFHWMRNHKD
jgi:hypothetical protein